MDANELWNRVIEPRFRAQEGKLDQIYKTLHGNGRSGLCTRITLVEWWIRGVSVVLSAVVIKTIIQLF
jgi:hypothetical protein